MNIGVLAALALVTSVAMVASTEITDGWSWLVAPALTTSAVVALDVRKGVGRRRLLLDTAAFVGLVYVGLPIALALVVFAAYAL
jgi:hypothetical protein